MTRLNESHECHGCEVPSDNFDSTYSILCRYPHIKPRDYTDFHKISVLILCNLVKSRGFSPPLSTYSLCNYACTAELCRSTQGVENGLETLRSAVVNHLIFRQCRKIAIKLDCYQFKIAVCGTPPGVMDEAKIISYLAPITTRRCLNQADRTDNRRFLTTPANHLGDAVERSQNRNIQSR